MLSFPWFTRRSASGVALAAALLAALLGRPAAGAKPPLVGITVQPALAALIPGQTLELRAIGHYADGSTADVTSKVAFRDESDATRIDKNVVTAKSEGEVEIYAVAKSGGLVSGETLHLSVSHVVALAIDPDDAGIRLGRETEFRALATLANGATRVGVTDFVEWSSSDPHAVKVGNERRTKGIAKAVRTGSATLEVVDPETGVTTRLALTVVSDLARVEVDPASRFLQLDDTTRFDAVGIFEGDVAADISADVRWESSDTRTATIDRFGLVEPRRLGVAGLIATEKRSRLSSAGAGANGVVSVVGELLEVAVAPAVITIPVGDEERLRAFGTFRTFDGGSAAFTLGRRVDWFTSDPTVAVAEAEAEAEANGDVHCLAPGTATFSARDQKSGLTSTETGGDGVVTCS